ncbi:TPA: hypothetical protein ACRNJF_002849, partial [Pseudomonas aeruginosa]
MINEPGGAGFHRHRKPDASEELHGGLSMRAAHSEVHRALLASERRAIDRLCREEIIVPARFGEQLTKNVAIRCLGDATLPIERNNHRDHPGATGADFPLDYHQPLAIYSACVDATLRPLESYLIPLAARRMVAQHHYALWHSRSRSGMPHEGHKAGTPGKN